MQIPRNDCNVVNKIQSTIYFHPIYVYQNSVNSIVWHQIAYSSEHLLLLCSLIDFIDDV